MNQYKAGALLTYANMFVTILGGLVVTPFIVNTLGKSEYGLYSLIGSLMAYFLLFDFGLGTAVVRYVVQYKTEDNRRKVSSFLGNITFLYLCISILVITLGCVFLCYFDNMFSGSLTPDQLVDGRKMFLLALFSIAIRLPAGVFQGVCLAYEKFIFSRLLAILHYLIRIATVFLLLKGNPTGITLVLIDLVIAVFTYSISAIYVLSRLKIRFDFTNIKMTVFKEVLSYSCWILLMNVTIAMIWQVAPVFAGMYLGTASVAIISIAVTLGSYYGTFASAVNGLLLPKTTQMVTMKASSQELTDFVIRVARFTVPVLSCVLGGFFLFGKSFIILWLGDSFSQSWFLGLCAMSATTVSLTLCAGNSILESYGKVKTRSLFSFLSLSLGALLSWILVKTYGVYGAMLPVMLTWSINTVFSCLYYKYVFGFQNYRFFKQAYFRSIPCLLLCLAVGFGSKYVFNDHSWLGLFGQVISYSVFSLLIFMLFVYSAAERKYILSLK